MLHDLDYGRLENEYRPAPPRKDDPVLCFRGAEVLLHRREDGALRLPAAVQFPGEVLRYAFRIRNRNYYLNLEADIEAAGFAWEKTRSLRQIISKEVCLLVADAGCNGNPCPEPISCSLSVEMA